jgi:nifR3 family TIM-barrel protein
MDISGKALLAPLSTFTNLPFRLLCQKHGAQGTTVPLICAKAIVKKGIKNEELDPDPSEKFVSVQLFGSQPEDIGIAAKLVAQNHPYIKYIDINCACPVKKVMKTGAGSALLYKPEKIAAMIKEARGCGLPVTVKVRKLADASTTLAICKTCEDAGADAIFIHPRTPSQGYSGEPDWDLIKQVSANSSIPIIGSGDIRSLEQGKERCASAGIASFMIGRAAMADPDIFSSLIAIKPTHERKLKLFMEYYELCERFDLVYFPDLRSKALQLLSGFHDGVKIRRMIGNAKTLDELLNSIGI